MGRETIISCFLSLSSARLAALGGGARRLSRSSAYPSMEQGARHRVGSQNVLEAESMDRIGIPSRSLWHAFVKLFGVKDYEYLLHLNLKCLVPRLAHTNKIKAFLFLFIRTYVWSKPGKL